MKRFLAIFLVLTLLFSFAACNKNETPDAGEDVNKTTENQADEQTTDGEEDTTKRKPRPETTTAAPFENPNLTEPAALFKVVGFDNYNLKSAAPNTTASSGVTFIIKRYEIKNSTGNTLSANVDTEGTKFVLNETLLKDFVANGWTIISKKDANAAIEAGDETSVILKNNAGKTTKLVVTNKTSTSMALADCVITEIGILKTITEQVWAEFTIDGKAGTTGSTYADFVNTFGKPISINVSEYYKGNDYTHSKVAMIFEQKIGNETWTLSVSYEDKATGEVELQSCIFEVK